MALKLRNDNHYSFLKARTLKPGSFLDSNTSIAAHKPCNIENAITSLGVQYLHLKNKNNKHNYFVQLL